MVVDPSTRRAILYVTIVDYRVILKMSAGSPGLFVLGVDMMNISSLSVPISPQMVGLTKEEPDQGAAGDSQ